MRGHRLGRLGLVAAAPVLVAGCGGTGAVSQAGAAHDRGAPAHHLRVGLTEWSILTSADTVAAGRVVLTVTNTGATRHDLVVHGPEGDWATSDLDPGSRTTLTIRVRPSDRLMLWCAEPGHREQGMQTTLGVSASAP